MRRTSLVYLLGLTFPLCARAADTDGDGLEDADEVLAHLPPLVADSDGDGLFDHLDPDMDGDEVLNVDECRLGGVTGLALVNGGFEEPDYSGSGVNYPTTMPGWLTTDSAFEVWMNGFEGKNAYDGDQFVEMNAFAVGTLYQDVATAPGDVYLYAFSHRGRFGSDTINFNLGDPAFPLTTIRTVTDGPGAWGRWGGVISTSASTTRFAFQSVASACGLSCGNLLDAISFTPVCDLDTDLDGTTDALDTDSDGDGVLDGSDVCPGYDDATADPDGDLVCGALDTCPLDPFNDYDGDGYCGDVDLCSGFDDASDLDVDGMPDGCDTDRDGDGWHEWDDCDEDDPLVGAALLWYADMDADGYGDFSTEVATCYPDAGWVTDKHDCDDGNAALNPGALETCFDTVDMDCDGSVSFTDYDLDGVCEAADPCPVDNPDDTDGDGLCQSSDPCPIDPMNDEDGDGLCANVDACPLDPANDADGDLVCGDLDLCPGADDRVNTDGDLRPDACDPCPADFLNDADGDGSCDSLDLCPGSDDNEDADADGVADGCDPCPDVPYEARRDLDADGTYDECDTDADDDGVAGVDDCDDLDMSQGAATLWFLDYDRDGFGDAMTSALACDQPPSYVSLAGDCEDARADTFPGATELCTDETDKNCDGVLAFDDPDYDGACGAADPCPLVYGFVCDTGDTATDTSVDTGETATDTALDTSSDTATDTGGDTGGEDTGVGDSGGGDTGGGDPPVCDTATVTVFVDEEDPELYRGGWRCGVGAGRSSLSLVALSLLAALWTRRAARR
jgi:hypothetical protein